MSNGLLFLLFYVGPVAVSFLMGTTLRVWSIAVWPTLVMGYAAWAYATEPPDYDMSGYSLLIGGALAAVCVIAWLLGRGLAWIVTRVERARYGAS